MADSVDKQGDSVVTLLDSGLIRYALGERDQAIQLWQQALEQRLGQRLEHLASKRKQLLTFRGHFDDG